MLSVEGADDNCLEQLALMIEKALIYPTLRKIRVRISSVVSDRDTTSGHGEEVNQKDRRGSKPCFVGQDAE